MRRLLFALLVTSAAIAVSGPAAAAEARQAGAARPAGPAGQAGPAALGKARPRDLTIVAPSTLYLSAPPYAYPGGVITYGAGALSTIRKCGPCLAPGTGSGQ